MPVIILSAYDQEELITRAFALGAVDHIVPRIGYRMPRSHGPSPAKQ